MCIVFIYYHKLTHSMCQVSLVVKYRFTLFASKITLVNGVSKHMQQTTISDAFYRCNKGLRYKIRDLLNTEKCFQ